MRSHATSATPPISTRSVAVHTGPSCGTSTRRNTNDRLQMVASASRRARSPCASLRPPVPPRRGFRAPAARACGRGRRRSRSARRALPTIRWHGTTIDQRIAARRRAGGARAVRARRHPPRSPRRSRYVAQGTAAIARHTARWNGVPRGASGRSKRVRVPAKYSASCASRGRAAPAWPAPRAIRRDLGQVLLPVEPGAGERRAIGDQQHVAQRRGGCGYQVIVFMSRSLSTGA